MSGLPDLEPSETVKVGGADVPVPGVSLKGVIMLFKRFPDLFDVMRGQSVEAAKLLDIGGDAGGAIIAAGIGYPGDKKQESIASKLPLEVQCDLLGVIIRVTMPNGAGPFMQKVTAVIGTLTVEEPSAPSSAAPVRAPAPVFPRGANVTRVKASSRHLDA